ncbi:MAG: substrate-binding domain-containing protein [Theionarchaea archaeon]|nr:substrate-binding domain-containing protein [Theionarchaea archaeon]MBU7001314.1 substrate-binding domain-containing protein [Theionarchaea archaeon]MBU7019805.1 substrate-binding domain-containing protein [Theionarchaea archaeon]MBU7040771.1 substrate-binding domain-containing protein [Theionarchaea archaeon]
MKSKVLRIFCSVVVMAALVSSCCITQKSETINVSGAWALYPLMVKWAEEYTNLHPEIRIDVSAGGAGKGMADVLGGLVDIGMVSREIYPEEIEKGAFWVAVAKDAVVPIFNKENPYAEDILNHGVSRQVFTDIFITGKVTTWGDILGKPEITEKVHVYTRSDACGAAQTWAQYLGFAQEDLIGVGVYGDPGIVEAVGSDEYGIGYGNLNFAYDASTGAPSPGVIALPLDLDGNGTIEFRENVYATKSDVIAAIDQGIYPSPPARALHLVTKGAPEGLVKEFLIWILTEGQQYVSETGYIGLGERIQEELEKLEG